MVGVASLFFFGLPGVQKVETEKEKVVTEVETKQVSN